MKYRRKPESVTAEQWFPGRGFPGVKEWPEFPRCGELVPGTTVLGHTTTVRPGDWVVTHPSGLREVFSPETFEELYESQP